MPKAPAATSIRMSRSSPLLPGTMSWWSSSIIAQNVMKPMLYMARKRFESLYSIAAEYVSTPKVVYKKIWADLRTRKVRAVIENEGRIFLSDSAKGLLMLEELVAGWLLKTKIRISQAIRANCLRRTSARIYE